ncbi:alpha beta hydrolase superfamily protein [Lactobacillus hamsteri DSM 5661 = JCM 6256]|uniref:Alpha beta hydrolase superfamily protein n=2 Tax=Lactobacillus hamsteri TaxID=96565 RepID=A0A0R1YE21_9LACO|nr:alpha beta hydrolase superfamily protein [Lactobacillus hamsteri DSM 5661 = JCM 6256]
MASIMSFLTACNVSSTGKDTAKKAKTAQIVKKPKFKDTPTLYFHGLMGSYKNEEPLVNAAKRAQKSNSIIRANVDDHGKVKLKGTIKKNAKNPIVEVNFKDNVQPNFSRNGTYASNVVKALQKKYYINKVNMVGYSLGNMAIMYYMIQNGNKKKMPKLVKQVSIAGHYDGAYFKELPPGFRQPKGLKLDKNGKPNKMNQTYKEMLAARPIYQKNKVKILNIYGDVGNNSDGVVEIPSALSLKYLTPNSDYHLAKFTGVKADHGGLPNNPKVIQKIIEFLW